MPDGDFRRPPQLWEQKLAQLVSMTSVGVVSGSGTDPNSPDLPPGDGGPGVEPDPVIPAPVDFIAPSTPSVTGTVQGLRVAWDGLNADGNPYPPGAYVEVHYSTTSATFTPSSSTLAGTLLGSAGFFSIMGLTAGVTYFVRLVGVDAAGNRTSPSTAASSQTGLTTTNDYGTGTITSGAVSFDARAIGGITTTVGTTAPSSPVTGDIWLDSTGGAIVHKRWSGSAWVTQAWGSSSISANAITATQIAAGAVTAGAIAANAVTAEKINASAVTADKIAADAITGKTITGGTITGATVQSSSGSSRVVLTTGNKLAFFGGSIERANVYLDSNDLTFESADDFRFGDVVNSNTNTKFVKFINTGGATGHRIEIGSINNPDIIYLDSNEVRMEPVYNQESTNAANVRIGADTVDFRLARSTSTVRVKDELAPLVGQVAGVSPSKLADFPASVDPYDVLDLAPTEFQSLCDFDGGARVLGFIAEDVEVKFPWATTWDSDGQAIAVEDRPILAALLTVVKEQQQQIQDLTARIEALEA